MKLIKESANVLRFGGSMILADQIDGKIFEDLEYLDHRIMELGIRQIRTVGEFSNFWKCVKN